MKHLSTILFSLVCCFNLVFFTPNTSYGREVSSTSIEQPAPLRFVVYYQGDFNKMMDKNGKLKSFLEAYNLEVVNTFEIDEETKGFTIEDKTGEVIDPYDLAKELSLYDGVMVVEAIAAPPAKTVI